MVWDDVRTAIGQLRRRWFESLIVVVMVTGGAALAVSIVELGLRFGSETERDLQRPEHRRLFVLPAMNRHSSGGAVTRLANAAVGEVEFSRDLIAEAAESVPQVHDPYCLASFSLTLDTQLFDETPEWIAGWATSPSLFRAFGLKARFGSLFTETDFAEGRPVMVLGAVLAEQMAGSKPLESLLGRVMESANAEFTIIGILEHETIPGRGEHWRRERVAYAPATSVFGTSLATGWPSFALMVDSDADLDLAQKEVERFFDLTSGAGAVSVEQSARQLIEFAERMQPLLLLVAALAFLTLFAAGTSACSVLSSQAERRVRQVAITRAIGASRRDVFSSCIVESSVVGLIAGGAAALLAVALSSLLQSVLRSGGLPGGSMDDGNLWAIGATAVATGVATMVVFGMIPASRAARIDPVELLREE